jgi:pseudaminic acid synthase
MPAENHLAMTTSFAIAGRPIGPEHPPYVIAEMSGNHNGDIRRAFELLEAAKAAGADAVKLQTYTADTITIDHDSTDFRIDGGLWAGKTLYALYQEAHTPWAWHRELFARAHELDLTIFSSPFDETAVDFLEELKVPAYKIASFEAVDLPLIRRVAATGEPLIISTGMASLEEIHEAVDAARSAGAHDLVLLHCVSGYPTPAGEANLRTLSELATKFDSIVGLSDHTTGTAVSIAAVALGASVIEKHFTLRRADGGPDAAFSLEPEELADLVSGCRTAWQALGKAGFERKPSEEANIQFRRSLYVVEDMVRGEVFTKRNVRSIRPGFGLPPKHLPEVLGRLATMDIHRGTALSHELIGQQGK